MTIDVQWAITNLATKADVERIEETLHENRTATQSLRETLDRDISRRLTATEQRVTDLEAYRSAQLEERRETIRRSEDRSHRWTTWVIALIAPAIAIIALGWRGIQWFLEVMHVAGSNKP